MVRSVSRSAAGLAAKRTPAPGQAAGAVDLLGALFTAGRVRVRMLGALAFQRLAELALDLFLGTFRLRRGVSHADLLPGRPYPQLRTCDVGTPPGRVAGSDRRRRRTYYAAHVAKPAGLQLRLAGGVSPAASGGHRCFPASPSSSRCSRSTSSATTPTTSCADRAPRCPGSRLVDYSSPSDRARCCTAWTCRSTRAPASGWSARAAAARA